MLPCCSLHTFNTVWLGIKPLYLTVLSTAGFHYSVTIHAGHGYNTTGTLYVTLHGSWGDTGVMQVTEWVTNTLSTMLSSCHPFLFVSDDVCTLIWEFHWESHLPTFWQQSLDYLQCNVILLFPVRDDVDPTISSFSWILSFVVILIHLPTLTPWWAYTQLVKEYSTTVISARGATVEWSWPIKWKLVCTSWSPL